MANKESSTNLRDYLKSSIVDWVDRDLLRMQFTPYVIDLAIYLGQLEPMTPGETIVGGDAGEDFIVTENMQVYAIRRARLGWKV